MIKVKQNLVSKSKYGKKCPYKMNPTSITVHNTYNDASAENEVKYMVSNNNSTSFHIAIDDKEGVQGIPFDRNAWHCGNSTGNRNSIGVEICYSKSGGFRFDKAEKNAAEWIANELKRRGWGIDRVRTHKSWSGKDCPHRTLDRGWDRFLNMIKSYMTNLNKEVNDMKTIVTYLGDADIHAAIVVSQKNKAPLMKVEDFKASGLKADRVIQIGGNKADTNRYETFKNAAKLL